jgi:hypothetical protein
MVTVTGKPKEWKHLGMSDAWATIELPKPYPEQNIYGKDLLVKLSYEQYLNLQIHPDSIVYVFPKEELPQDPDWEGMKLKEGMRGGEMKGENE